MKCIVRYFKNLPSVLFHSNSYTFYHWNVSRNVCPLLNYVIGPWIENTPSARFSLKNDQKDVLISIWECLCLPNYWSDLFSVVINRVCSNWHCVHANERTIDNCDNPWKELSSLVVWSCICHLDCVYDLESSTGLNFQIENRWENTSSPFKEVFVIFLICI